jgi:hypothetical protein
MENGELNLITLAQHFSNEDKAREYIEKLRWPDGPVCPHCGEINNAYRAEALKSPKRASMSAMACGSAAGAVSSLP